MDYRDITPKRRTKRNKRGKIDGPWDDVGGDHNCPYPKGPKYLYGTKYGFCSSNFPYGLGKYSPYGYLGPFGIL